MVGCDGKAPPDYLNIPGVKLALLSCEVAACERNIAEGSEKLGNRGERRAREELTEQLSLMGLTGSTGDTLSGIPEHWRARTLEDTFAVESHRTLSD